MGRASDRLLEPLSVAAAQDPRIEDGEDPPVIPPADQSAEPLTETHDRLGKHVDLERIEPILAKPLAVRLDERIVRDGEREAHHHEDLEILPREIDPFPETRGAEEDRPLARLERFREGLSRLLPLRIEVDPPVLERAADPLLDPPQGLVRREEDQNLPWDPGGKPEDPVGKIARVPASVGS